MRIEFQRTGGFAGMRSTTTIDTDDLSSEEVADLRALIDDAGFFDLPATLPAGQAPGADRFAYTLTIEDGDRRHTIETSEAGAPETLQPLLRRLDAIARARR